MRKLEHVIDAICEAIPPEEEDLVLSLQEIKDSVLHAAPEMQQFWWRVAANELNEYLPKELNDWQRIVLAIWQDKYKEGKVCF